MIFLNEKIKDSTLCDFPKTFESRLLFLESNSCLVAYFITLRDELRKNWKNLEPRILWKNRITN